MLCGKNVRSVCVSAAVALVAVFSQTAYADLIVNGGFESPVVAGNDIVTPTEAESGWAFVPNSGGVAGILGKDGAAAWGLTDVTDQTAAICNGKFTQNVSGFIAGTASFTFSAINFIGSLPGDALTVKLDGTVLKFGGDEAVVGGASMAPYTSDPIPVTSGDHILQFEGNTWYFVNNVTCSNVPVPEPATCTLVSLGLIGLLAYVWRKRK